MKQDIQSERYEPPKIEILLAEVERGYDNSGGGVSTPGWEVISNLRDEDDLYNF